MKLEVNGIEIIKHMGTQAFVRISIGGHMFFDSPIRSKKITQDIFDNLDRRLE